MNLVMTKIYKFQDDISTDALNELEKHSSLAIDTEGSGLQIPHRDKLSLVQFSTGNNDAYIVQPNRKSYKAPNIVKILENAKITKIGHYLRYDVSGLEYFLKDQANQFSNKVNRLNLLSPLNTLSRGYSITHDKDGKVLLSSKKINLGDLISSQLHDGKVTSKVLKKEDN